MIDFPIAKINLGLNIVRRRADGYHDLETVFYPIPLKDALEVQTMDEGFPSATDCDIKVTNINIEGNEQDNLVVRAYNLIKERYDLPRIHTHLYKGIPTRAGMGGGSSDCAFMIKLLDRMFALGMGDTEMKDYATRLGADCPFFLMGVPAYAEGIGEKLEPIGLSLEGLTIGIVCPHIPISTKEAFSRIKPRQTEVKCREIVMQPIETWRSRLTNDFEEGVFALHPEIGLIKQKLYELGAVYASMSGSGSSVFGLFRTPVDLTGLFGDAFVYTAKL